MRSPSPIVGFIVTWASVLLVYVGYVVYYNITITEPDMKFGESAPYITLAIMGGLGGFTAGIGALIAVFVYEQRRQVTLSLLNVAAVSALVSLAYSLGAWYAAVWSPLPLFGTIAAWLLTCTVVHFAAITASNSSKGNA